MTFKPSWTYPADIMEVWVGPCGREDMGYKDAKLCGSCNTKPAKSLTCAKCRVQTYCSKEGQKDFARHKAHCRTPRDKETKSGEKTGMWMNGYYLRLGDL